MTKLVALAAMTAFLTMILAQGITGTYEIRGKVADIRDSSVIWDPQSFAGFYYDINSKTGTEQLIVNITDGNKLSGDSPYGIVYTTTAQPEHFRFNAFGSYNVIGFLGDKCFAGYVQDSTLSVENQIPYMKSTDRDTLTKNQLFNVLEDDNKKQTIYTGTPLKLAEGYELAIKSFDPERKSLHLELSKNGAVIDSQDIAPTVAEVQYSNQGGSKFYNVITPPNANTPIEAGTYCYKKDFGDLKGLVIIAVHFKNAGKADQDLATIDGEWQISDTPINLKVDEQYDKMSIRNVDPTTETITMDNKDNQVTLSKNKDVMLMGNIQIKTADSKDEPNRFYIHKSVQICQGSS